MTIRALLDVAAGGVQLSSDGGAIVTGNRIGVPVKHLVSVSDSRQ